MEDDVADFYCEQDSLQLSKKPLWHYTADRLLEPDRDLLIEEKVSGGCGAGGNWGVFWERSFRPIEGGKLGTPVLTLESRSQYSVDSSELTEMDTTYSLAGGWPKQVVVTTDTTTCVRNVDDDCARKTRKTTRETWELKDGKYQMQGKVGRKKTR